ncbi:MAG: class I SAM-dependent methyltransferase, partial [Erysipelotrichaceae bacterium]|nr:class I SAM-dependent methyltransferase [Erysipelotrichaceae bacterium]
EIVTKLYHNARTMTALDYIDLLSTYSDHHILLNHNEFKKAIIKAINDNGNMIKIYDTIDLYLAKK